MLFVFGVGGAPLLRCTARGLRRAAALLRLQSLAAEAPSLLALAAAPLLGRKAAGRLSQAADQLQGCLGLAPNAPPARVAHPAPPQSSPLPGWAA